MRKLRIGLIVVGLIGVLILLLFLVVRREKSHLPVQAFYDYDQTLPLQDSVTAFVDSNNYSICRVAYNSIHHERVHGLLSIPKAASAPPPVIILLHGLGDRKTVDYIEAGHSQFLDHGYAVFRIDIANHGERNKVDYPFDLTGGYKYWTREVLTQTVFDLRRAVDFLSTRTEIDPDRIGYYGISLGGIIGTLFCSVDQRVKVPVIALAGGNLNLMFGEAMISDATLNYLSIIDPNNFVADISPRPLLMINAEQDEIIPPLMSKLLFQKARKPKEIVWFPTRHREIPVEDSYGAGIKWFDDHL